ncbi:MAG: M55 family metallopeptidase [Candidatus Hydrothermia bacterium]
MKILISVDMEGIWGLVSWAEPQEKISYFVTKEVKLVIDQLFRHSKSAKIVVVDSHALGYNIIPDQLPDRVSLVRGFPRQFYMMETIDSSYDACMFIGYHAPIGKSPGQMDHSYSSGSFYEVAINGKIVGEAEINGLLASYFNVPVILISGDDVLKRFSNSHFPKTEFVVTKRAISRFSAELLPYSEVQESFSRAIEKALDNLKNIPPMEMTPPFTIEIATNDTLIAYLISQIPGASLIDGRKVSFNSSDYREIYKFLMVASYLGWVSKRLQN